MSRLKKWALISKVLTFNNLNILNIKYNESISHYHYQLHCRSKSDLTKPKTLTTLVFLKKGWEDFRGAEGKRWVEIIPRGQLFMTPDIGLRELHELSIKSATNNKLVIKFGLIKYAKIKLVFALLMMPPLPLYSFQFNRSLVRPWNVISLCYEIINASSLLLPKKNLISKNYFFVPKKGVRD